MPALSYSSCKGYPAFTFASWETPASGWSVGVVADSGGAGAALGAKGGNFGRLPVSSASWVAQGGAGHSSSQERSADSRGLGKKLPQDLAALLTPEAVGTRTAQIMFQDEARLKHDPCRPC